MSIHLIDRAALALGKGEVESSILSRSTRFSQHQQH